jgi:hypothetical protein
MNKAASKLQTMQSNVTARIRLLEREIGVALFSTARSGCHGCIHRHYSLRMWTSDGRGVREVGP